MSSELAVGEEAPLGPIKRHLAGPFHGIEFCGISRSGELPINVWTKVSPVSNSR